VVDRGDQELGDSPAKEWTPEKEISCQ